jgi:hypothetical protein
MSHPNGVQAAWDRALAGVRALSGALAELRSDFPTTLDLLREALSGVPHRRAALLLLRYLGPDYALAVIDRLVKISLSHRDALLVRQILGSLPYDEIARIVPVQVWEVLDEENDGDAYRRLAELLRHLGLFDSLQDLCERALVSTDSEVREVGEEFGRKRD